MPPAVFGLLVLVGVFFLYQVGGGIMTFLAMGDLTVTEDNVQTVRLVTLLSQLLFLLGPSLIFARLVSHHPLEVFPFRVPSVREFVVLLLGLLALQRVLETAVFLQHQIPLPDILRAVVEPLREMIQSMMALLLAADSTPEFFFVVTVVAVVPSFAEELYFRGLIQTLFSRAWSPLWGAIVSGILFGLFHLNPFDTVGLIGLGVFFGYARYRSASMVPPILLHFLNNFLAVVAVRMGLRNDEMLVESMGQSADMQTMLMQGLLFGLLFAWTLWLYHRITRSVAETAR
ncbi:MAG: CPBP family intramembrane glutamic endopeptidase [Bacteroidota bacterium]